MNLLGLVRVTVYSELEINGMFWTLTIFKAKVGDGGVRHNKIRS